MSDTYRGYPIPEVIQVDEYYWIVDERFGEHKGYTPEIAMMYWRLRVDTDLYEDAIQMGLVSVTTMEGVLLCNECGLLIGDITMHLNWHRNH